LKSFKSKKIRNPKFANRKEKEKEKKKKEEKARGAPIRPRPK
jgi:hypothetical protein